MLQTIALARLIITLVAMNNFIFLATPLRVDEEAAKIFKSQVSKMLEENGIEFSSKNNNEAKVLADAEVKKILDNGKCPVNFQSGNFVQLGHGMEMLKLETSYLLFLESTVSACIVKNRKKIIEFIQRGSCFDLACFAERSLGTFGFRVLYIILVSKTKQVATISPPSLPTEVKVSEASPSIPNLKENETPHNKKVELAKQDTAPPPSLSDPLPSSTSATATNSTKGHLPENLPTEETEKKTSDAKVNTTSRSVQNLENTETPVSNDQENAISAIGTSTDYDDKFGLKMNRAFNQFFFPLNSSDFDSLKQYATAKFGWDTSNSAKLSSSFPKDILGICVVIFKVDSSEPWELLSFLRNRMTITYSSRPKGIEMQECKTPNESLESTKLNAAITQLLEEFPTLWENLGIQNLNVTGCGFIYHVLVGSKDNQAEGTYIEALVALK